MALLSINHDGFDPVIVSQRLRNIAQNVSQNSLDAHECQFVFVCSLFRSGQTEDRHDKLFVMFVCLISNGSERPNKYQEGQLAHAIGGGLTVDSQ